MLDINPTIACAIIEHLRNFHAKDEDEEDIGSLNNESSQNVTPDMVEDESETDLLIQDDDADLDALKAIMEDLPLEHQAELVALMWLGREDYELSEWEQAYSEALRNAGNNTVEYLLTHPHAAEYIADGLMQFGYKCRDE